MRPSCTWGHVTKANPAGKPCGRPSFWQVNGPDGYPVCGYHRRSAEVIGETDIEWIVSWEQREDA